MAEGKVRSQGIVSGVLILTMASLFVKFIGVFYKIPLTYILGDEGMGYFNAAYTIYAWLYMLSTAGIPVALSILISEAVASRNGEGAYRVIRISSSALLSIGVTSTAAMALGAQWLAGVLGAPDARYTILAIAPTLFFICISALFRGIFQGHRNMIPTALSQLIEALGKVLFGILLARYAISRGYALPVVSAFAVSGVSIGTALGAVYLLVHYIIARSRGHLIDRKTENADVTEKRYGKRLLAIALPVTISASVMSLTGLIDLGMIIRRLVSVGFSQAEATALYGNYTTLVVPVFNLPSIVVSPIATGIIPAVSAAYIKGEGDTWKQMVQGAFRTVGVIAIPCAIGLGVFSRPILSLLYPAESVMSAYMLLTVVSPAVFFMCALTVSNAALQACGMSQVSMISMLAGGVVKVVSGYILLGEVGIVGSPIGTLLCYATALTINLLVLGHKSDFYLSTTDVLLKPLLSAALSIGACAALYYYVLANITPCIGILACVGLSAALYISMSFLTKSIVKEDLNIIFKRRKQSVDQL